MESHEQSTCNETTFDRRVAKQETNNVLSRYFYIIRDPMQRRSSINQGRKRKGAQIKERLPHTGRYRRTFIRPCRNQTTECNQYKLDWHSSNAICCIKPNWYNTYIQAAAKNTNSNTSHNVTHYFCWTTDSADRKPAWTYVETIWFHRYDHG